MYLFVEYSFNILAEKYTTVINMKQRSKTNFGAPSPHVDQTALSLLRCFKMNGVS